MSKQRLQDLVKELQVIFDEIDAIADCNKGITIIEDEYVESFSAINTLFEQKLMNYKKKLLKIAEKLPSERRKRTKRDDIL